jgi:hypothetical protein
MPYLNWVMSKFLGPGLPAPLRLQTEHAAWLDVLPERYATGPPARPCRPSSGQARGPISMNWPVSSRRAALGETDGAVRHRDRGSPTGVQVPPCHRSLCTERRSLPARVPPDGLRGRPAPPCRPSTVNNTDGGQFFVWQGVNSGCRLTGSGPPAFRGCNPDSGYPRLARPARRLRESGNPRNQPVALIGVGRTDWVRSPLPPNRTCGSPASGSPVDGLPARGLAYLGMGALQAEDPMPGKEGIGQPDVSDQVVPLAAFDPFSRPASIRAVHTRGSTHDHSWCGAIASRISPACVALSGTATGLSPLVMVIESPSSCTPWLPRHYPASSLL